MKSFQLTWMLILISSSLLFSQQKTYTIKSELTSFILVPFVEDWQKSMKKQECNYPWIELEIEDRNSSYDWVKAVNQGKATYLIVEEDTVNGVRSVIAVIPVKMDRSLGLKSLLNKFYKEYNFSENGGEAPAQFKDEEGRIYELKDEYVGKMFEFKIKESLCQHYLTVEFFELFSVKLVRDNAKNDKKVEISTLITQENNEVTIGNQVWTTKNLDVSTFRNGGAIPEAKNAKQWDYARENKIAAFCYYDYDSNNGKVYGKLYNWYAVNDSRGLAPKGYHIPSDAEWTILTDMLGGEEIAGKKMKSTTGWSNSGSGNNRSGFNGLPGGNCCFNNGFFNNITAYGFWWSSSVYNTNDAWNRILSSFDTKVSRNFNYKYFGFSVRCLRD